MSLEIRGLYFKVVDFIGLVLVGNIDIVVEEGL